MQGRLVPAEGGRIQCFPRERWRDEFALAQAAGLDAIEWIDDVWGDDANPIRTAAGRAEMQALSEQFGVVVASICADWFMDHPLGSDPDAGARLAQLLDTAPEVGVVRVTIPFVEEASIVEDRREAVVAALTSSLTDAERSGVELHLESDLPPAAFRQLLDELPHSMLRVNYDSGNSAALDYDLEEELEAYGARIGSVHIKDRVRGGETVALGEGNAQLDRMFELLRHQGYRGDFVLQVARGIEGEELAWARQNREFVERRWRA